MWNGRNLRILLPNQYPVGQRHIFIFALFSLLSIAYSQDRGSRLANWLSCAGIELTLLTLRLVFSPYRDSSTARLRPYMCRVNHFRLRHLSAI